MTDYFWLIPFIPLVGVVINGLFGRRIKNEKVIGAIACATILAAFVIAVISVAGLAELPAEERHVEATLYDWIPAGMAHLSDDAQEEAAPLTVRVAFLLDPLSAVMILLVTGVGFLIHVYATGYMHGDDGYYRFFTYLNLFVFFMLILVLGNSYGLMFIGWEGVGLCSYLLIGYYIGKRSAGDAGKKAFIVNRVGDLGFILGILTIFFTFGSLDYLQVFEGAHEFEMGAGVITTICLFLLIGAAGKSAQIPLYVWLPDAMEGPTPVSALIHAATMVTAGVYMIARSSVLFALSPFAMTTVAIVGAATALLAASIALVQNDIKRVLAYSTVSQLGYMVMACGVGAFSAGIFHLLTHGFFKALLFLGAGSVMHALHDELDMWKMGNVKKYMPTTHWTFLIGCLAIAGVPGLAGFFSKDEILWYAWSGPYGHPLLWAVGTLVAGMTAFYMFRMYFLVFQGESRLDPEVEAHAHESPQGHNRTADDPGWSGSRRRLYGHSGSAACRPAGGAPRPLQHLRLAAPVARRGTSTRRRIGDERLVSCLDPARRRSTAGGRARRRGGARHRPRARLDAGLGRHRVGRHRLCLPDLHQGAAARRGAARALPRPLPPVVEQILDR